MDTTVEVALGNPPTDAEGRELREYFCRMCPEKAKGYTIPKGWIVVRKTHVEGEGPKTIGLYNTGMCLAVDVLSKELRITPAHARLLLVSHNR